MFSERIKELRKANGLTQAELAKKLNVSASTVGMYEQGRREPDSEMLAKISDIFDVTIDYLLGADSKSVSASKDLSLIFSRLASDVKNKEGLMFNGTPLNKEDVEKVVDAMELGMRLALEQQGKTSH